MTPTECPRCKRPAEEWTLEREHLVAGCPCGEVVAISFEDEEPSRLGQTVSATPKKPPEWVEHALLKGWRGAFTPTLTRRSWSGSVAAIVASVLAWAWVLATPPHGTLFSILATGATTLTFVAFVIASVRFQSGQSWALSFEDGRFRADFERRKCDLPASEILGFGVEPVRTRRSRASAQGLFGLPSFEVTGPPFELCVYRENAEKIHLPLYGRSADEVQFVTDRMNELLASGGRMEGGYRGEHARVEIVGSSPREETAEESEDEVNRVSRR